MLSKSCENAIRAAVLLARKSENSDRKFIPVQELAEELELSFHFLAKILQRLTESSLLESFRGPRGGVALARPANEINLCDVITAIDGNRLFEDCVLGLSKCNDKTPCPMHRQWKKQRNELKVMFQKSTLADLAEDKRQFNLK